MISAIDRNREHGQIETPHWPALRAATPVYAADGQLFGIVVVNVDMTSVFDRLRRPAGAEGALYVFDQDGRFLVHPDTRHEFAFEFDRSYDIADAFPGYDQVFPAPTDGRRAAMLQDADGRRVILGIYDAVIDAGRQERTLHFAREAEFDGIIAVTVANALPLGGTLVLIMIPVLLLGLFFVDSVICKPLNEITGSIEGYTPGKPIATLPIDRPDEIGTLARTFGRLIEQMEKRRTTLHRQIARRIEAEEQMRYLAAAVEHAIEAIAILDNECVYRYVNPAYERLRNSRAADVVGKQLWDLGHQQTASREYRDMWDSVLNGKPCSTRYKTVARDGTHAFEDTTVSPVRDAAGAVTGIVVVIRDITERVLMEEQNKKTAEEAARFSRVLEGSLNEIYIFDADTLRFVSVNEGGRENLGYSMAELQSMTPVDLKPEFTNEAFAAKIEPLRTGDEFKLHFTTTHQRKDGTQYPIEVHLQLMDEDNPPVFCAMIIDITERQRAEEERGAMELRLRQAQKLESIGQLAAGIAHEINTPTQYVSDNTVFLQRAFDGLMGAVAAGNELLDAARSGGVNEDAIAHAEAAFKKAKLDFLQKQVPPAFEQSLEGLEQVSRIVSAMKEFSHPAQDKTRLDLNRAIQSTITVARNEWKYVAEMHTEFDESLPHVPCLPGEFNQVILNIIVNAAHAISDVVGDGADGRGQITVTTRHDDDCAEVRIGDTGAGMSEDVRARIFDAFFTTKEVGKGTGQGLAIAYNVIVEKHGGTIDVESAPGEGTTFILRLPLNATTDDAGNNTDAGERAA